MGDLGAVLATALRLWRDALLLDPHPALGPGTPAVPGGWAPFIVVAVVATLSTAVGRSVVLYVNRLRGTGLAFALLTAVGARLVEAVLGGCLLWLGIRGVEGVIPRTAIPALSTVVQTVLLATSPFVLSFLVVVPLLGPVLERALQLWGLAILWGGIAGVWGDAAWHPGVLAIGAVLLAATLGMMGVQAVLSRPAARLRDHLYLRATGRPLHHGTQHLLDLVEPPRALPGPGATDAGLLP